MGYFSNLGRIALGYEPDPDILPATAMPEPEKVVETAPVNATEEVAVYAVEAVEETTEDTTQSEPTKNTEGGNNVAEPAAFMPVSNLENRQRTSGGTRDPNLVHLQYIAARMAELKEDEVIVREKSGGRVGTESRDSNSPNLSRQDLRYPRSQDQRTYVYPKHIPEFTPRIIRFQLE